MRSVRIEVLLAHRNEGSALNFELVFVHKGKIQFKYHNVLLTDLFLQFGVQQKFPLLPLQIFIVLPYFRLNSKTLAFLQFLKVIFLYHR